MSYQDPPRIDPATLDSEELLAGFLAEIGFKSQPIAPQADMRIMRQAGYDSGRPQRLLIAQDQRDPGLGSHAVVAIEEAAMCIYYYEMENDLFRIWRRLAGQVEIGEIRRTIRAALRAEEPAALPQAHAPDLASSLSPPALFVLRAWIWGIMALVLAVMLLFVTGVLGPMVVAAVRSLLSPVVSFGLVVRVGLPWQIGIFNLDGFPPGMYPVRACPAGEVCDRIDLVALARDLAFWFVPAAAGLLLRARLRRRP